MSTGSTTTDIYVLLITFVVGFALGCVVEFLRERWEERRLWYGSAPKDKPKDPEDKSKGGPPWTPV